MDNNEVSRSRGPKTITHIENEDVKLWLSNFAPESRIEVIRRSIFDVLRNVGQRDTAVLKKALTQISLCSEVRLECISLPSSEVNRTENNLPEKPLCVKKSLKSDKKYCNKKIRSTTDKQCNELRHNIRHKLKSIIERNSAVDVSKITSNVKDKKKISLFVKENDKRNKGQVIDIPLCLYETGSTNLKRKSVSEEISTPIRKHKRIEHTRNCQQKRISHSMKKSLDLGKDNCVSNLHKNSDNRTDVKGCRKSKSDCKRIINEFLLPGSVNNLPEVPSKHKVYRNKSKNLRKYKTSGIVGGSDKKLLEESGIKHSELTLMEHNCNGDEPKVDILQNIMTQMSETCTTLRTNSKKTESSLPVLKHNKHDNNSNNRSLKNHKVKLISKSYENLDGSKENGGVQIVINISGPSCTILQKNVENNSTFSTTSSERRDILECKTGREASVEKSLKHYTLFLEPSTHDVNLNTRGSLNMDDSTDFSLEVPKITFYGSGLDSERSVLKSPNVEHVNQENTLIVDCVKNNERVGKNTDSQQHNAGNNVESKVGKIRVRDINTLLAHSGSTKESPALPVNDVNCVKRCSPAEKMVDCSNNHASGDIKGIPKYLLECFTKADLRFMKLYTLKFNELVDSKVEIMAGLLHMGITDAMCKEERLKWAEKLLNSKSITSEKQRLEKEFRDNMRQRGIEVSALLGSIVKKFEKDCVKEMFLALYVGLIEGILKIDSEHIKHFHLSRNIIYNMLLRNNYKDRIIMNLLQESDEKFEESYCKINSLLKFCNSFYATEDGSIHKFNAVELEQQQIREGITVNSTKILPSINRSFINEKSDENHVSNVTSGFSLTSTNTSGSLASNTVTSTTTMNGLKGFSEKVKSFKSHIGDVTEKNSPLFDIATEHSYVANGNKVITDDKTLKNVEVIHITDSEESDSDEIFKVTKIKEAENLDAWNNQISLKTSVLDEQRHVGMVNNKSSPNNGSDYVIIPNRVRNSVSESSADNLNASQHSTGSQSGATSLLQKDITNQMNITNILKNTPYVYMRVPNPLASECSNNSTAKSVLISKGNKGLNTTGVRYKVTLSPFNNSSVFVANGNIVSCQKNSTSRTVLPLSHNAPSNILHTNNQNNNLIHAPNTSLSNAGTEYVNRLNLSNTEDSHFRPIRPAGQPVQSQKKVLVTYQKAD